MLADIPGGLINRLSHTRLHLSALNDFKKMYRNHHSLIILCPPEPDIGFTIPPPGSSFSETSSRPTRSASLRAPCGKTGCSLGSCCPERGRWPQSGESGLPQAPWSSHPAYFGVRGHRSRGHSPPGAAGSSNPARRSRWGRMGGDPQPAWGREEGETPRGVISVTSAAPR